VVTNGGSTSSGGGFTGVDAAAIAIGAILVLGGISLFIWRDARRRAPLRHRAAAAMAGVGGRSRSGSKPRPKPRKPSPAERRRRKRGRAR
jgi:predicted lipid-binding transport protein (Tim44 family)